MDKTTSFFIKLTILLVILELSCYGLYFTKSPLYLIPIVVATIGITLIGYGLYFISTNNQLKGNEYHFYYIDSNPSTDEFFNRVRKRL